MGAGLEDAPRRRPGPPGPPRTIVPARMDDTTITDLDALAAQAGVNRSETVRRLVRHGLDDKTIRALVVRR